METVVDPVDGGDFASKVERQAGPRSDSRECFSKQFVLVWETSMKSSMGIFWERECLSTLPVASDAKVVSRKNILVCDGK